MSSCAKQRDKIILIDNLKKWQKKLFFSSGQRAELDCRHFFVATIVSYRAVSAFISRVNDENWFRNIQPGRSVHSCSRDGKTFSVHLDPGLILIEQSSVFHFRRHMQASDLLHLWPAAGVPDPRVVWRGLPELPAAEPGRGCRGAAAAAKIGPLLCRLAVRGDGWLVRKMSTVVNETVDCETIREEYVLFRATMLHYFELRML